MEQGSYSLGAAAYNRRTALASSQQLSLNPGKPASQGKVSTALSPVSRRRHPFL